MKHEVVKDPKPPAPTPQGARPPEIDKRTGWRSSLWLQGYQLTADGWIKVGR